MHFLDRHDKHGDCFNIHTPIDFNDPDKVEALLRFMDLPRKKPNADAPSKGGNQNHNLTPTVITDTDEAEFQEVIAATPGSYLEIFHKAPYDAFPWADILRCGGSAEAEFSA